MVPHSHAIIEPGAVMIESFHASVANGAMPGARSPQDQAVGTHIGWVQLREQLKKLVLRAKVARIARRRNEKGYSNYWTQARDQVGQIVVLLF